MEAKGLARVFPAVIASDVAFGGGELWGVGDSNKVSKCCRAIVRQGRASNVGAAQRYWYLSGLFAGSVFFAGSTRGCRPTPHP